MECKYFLMTFNLILFTMLDKIEWVIKKKNTRFLGSSWAHEKSHIERKFVTILFWRQQKKTFIASSSCTTRSMTIKIEVEKIKNIAYQKSSDFNDNCASVWVSDGLERKFLREKIHTMSNCDIGTRFLGSISWDYNMFAKHRHLFVVQDKRWYYFIKIEPTQRRKNFIQRAILTCDDLKFQTHCHIHSWK